MAELTIHFIHPLEDEQSITVSLDENMTTQEAIAALIEHNFLSGKNQYLLTQQSGRELVHEESFFDAKLTSPTTVYIRNQNINNSEPSVNEQYEINKTDDTRVNANNQQYQTHSDYQEDQIEDDFGEDIGFIQESRTFHQLGILLLDGSGSMSRTNKEGRTLSEQVNNAVQEFLNHFQSSSIANNFSIAIITFDHQAQVHTTSVPLVDMDSTVNYSPIVYHGGGTQIGLALEKAEELAINHLNSDEADNLPHDVRIIILSDGLCQDAKHTKKVANRLKHNSKITLSSTLFVDQKKNKAAEALLKTLASSPNDYKTTYKAEDLRKFFEASMVSIKYQDRTY